MLRTALLASLALAPLLLVEGCIPFGCGGYSGGGDKVYQNGNDTLIVCSNGGFVALANGSMTLEGKVTDSDSGSDAVVTGNDGATGAVDFELTTSGDGTTTVPTLAPGQWSEASLDAAQLDHYDWYCQQLPSQSWWSASANP
jgi:hypothetical protein